MIYRVEIEDIDGERNFYKAQDEVLLYMLLRALEKCEIKWFKISLD